MPSSLPTRGWTAPRSPEPKDKGLLPPLEWGHARLRVPRGIQGMRMGLQGPHASIAGKGLAEQRRNSSTPVQRLSRRLAAVQRWEFSRWEAREKQGPEEGKHPDKQIKTERRDIQTPRPQSLVQQAWEVPGPGRAPGWRRARSRGRRRAPSARFCPGAPRLSPGRAVSKAAGTSSCAKAR